MATSAERRLRPKEIRRFGGLREYHQIPDLTVIQTRSYDAFLQFEVPQSKRKDHGIEGVLREIFPIESYDKTLKLEYVRPPVATGARFTFSRVSRTLPRPLRTSLLLVSS